MKNSKIEISANILIRNEYKMVDSLIDNLMRADIDEIVILDGGSTDGTFELLQEHQRKNNRIKLLSWPQDKGTAYKLGFKEKVRRNLMVEASSKKWILYIDSDERISSNFKSIVSQGIENKNLVRLKWMNFWDGDVRINMSDDKVWNSLQNRMFLRGSEFKFASKDRNGLHNYLIYRGGRIAFGDNRGTITQFALSVYNFFMSIYGLKTAVIPEAVIYHFHYYNLKNKKENDLRSGEFNNKKIICGNYNDGLNYTLKDGVVPCISACENEEIHNIVEQFISTTNL